MTSIIANSQVDNKYIVFTANDTSCLLDEHAGDERVTNVIHGYVNPNNKLVFAFEVQQYIIFKMQIETS